MSDLGFPLRGVGGWLLLGTAVPLWLVLTLLRYLATDQPFAAVMAVFFLLPALYVLIGAPIRYALVVVLHTARGHTEPPQVDVPELNPFQLPHVFLLVALTIAASALVLRVETASAQIAVSAAFAVFAAPFVTLVGLNDGLDSVNSRSLTWLISGLGAEALGLMLVGAAWVGLVSAVLAEPPRFVAVLGMIYLFILAHRLVGRLLYRHRSQLHLDTEISPEQDTAAQLKAVHQAFQDMLMELHRLCGTDRVEEAYQQLDRYRQTPDGLDEASVYTSLKEFHDSRLRLEYAFHYVDRLAERREPKRAWQVLADATGEDPAFRPSSDELLISLIAHGTPEQAEIVETLLHDFEDRFPDSHLTANALFRRARACLDHLDRGIEGRALLRRIDAEFPNFARQERFTAYRDAQES